MLDMAIQLRQHFKTEQIYDVGGGHNVPIKLDIDFGIAVGETFCASSR